MWSAYKAALLPPPNTQEEYPSDLEEGKRSALLNFKAIQREYWADIEIAPTDYPYQF